MFWGAPQVSANGFEIVSPTVFGSSAFTTYGRGTRGVGAATTGAIRSWASYMPATHTGTYLPCTLFAAVHLDSSSEAGCFVNFMNDAATGDTGGVGLGVGSTTMDGTGNNLVGVHGNVAWKASGQAIGTGPHTVAMTDSTGGVEWFVDGKSVGTGSASGVSNSFGQKQVMAMAEAGAGSNPRSCTTGVVVAMGAVWARVLSASEIARVHADPFCMLRF